MLIQMILDKAYKYVPYNNTGWLMCDKGICLYSERGCERAGGRCIKHGALLNYHCQLTGTKTRGGARAKIAEWDRQNARVKKLV